MVVLRDSLELWLLCLLRAGAQATTYVNLATKP